MASQTFITCHYCVLTHCCIVFSLHVGVGIDGLNSSGKLAELKVQNGPVMWVDSADSQPCIGTAGNLQWSIKANGKLFHSGLPHQVI
jgi:acetylornithine deacetylase